MAAATVLVEHRNLIIENWFRILCNSKISIQDIAKVIIEFSDQCEGFAQWTNYQNVEISKDSLTVCYDNKQENNDYY